MTTATSTAAPTVTNAQAQAAILASCPRELLRLGTFGSYNPGSTLRQKLTNVGLLRSILLHVQINYDVTAASTPSRLSPWNILSNIKVKDYQGTDIVNCDGPQLYTLQSIKYGKRFGLTTKPVQSLPYTEPVYSSNGELSGAVANNITADFFLRIPICYMPEVSLKGTLLMQSVTGEAFVECTFNNSFFGANDDSVFSAGAGSVNSINVSIYQDYLGLVNSVLPYVLPDSKGNVAFTDQFYVYELNGSLVTSSDLTAGQAKLINYPNFRKVLSMINRFSSGGNAIAGEMGDIKLVENANQYVQTWTEASLSQHIREGAGFDLIPGIYYLSTRNWPIDTVLYGNYQASFAPNSVPASSYMSVMFESFYQRGATLTGLSQGG